MATSFEEKAAERLTLEARKQAWMLGDLLEQYGQVLLTGGIGFAGMRNATKDGAGKPKAVASESCASRRITTTSKRGQRAAGIEALKRELIEHIRASRDHAQFLLDHDKAAELLPRPSQKELGLLIGLDKSAVSRCFNDPQANDLRMLWNIAGDLDSVMRYGRR